MPGRCSAIPPPTNRDSRVRCCAASSAASLPQCAIRSSVSIRSSSTARSRCSTDTSRRVHVTGGRVSCIHASYLARSLSLLRPDVSFVAGERAARASTLLDVTPESVVVVFDYRRYDDEVVDFGRGAAAAGASVIVLTDNYLSPIASSAAVLLTSSVEGPAPFITLTPGPGDSRGAGARRGRAVGSSAAGATRAFRRAQCGSLGVMRHSSASRALVARKARRYCCVIGHQFVHFGCETCSCRVSEDRQGWVMLSDQRGMGLRSGDA